MRFYSKQHKHYCGVDLHPKTIYVCIIDQEARIVKQKNIRYKGNREGLIEHFMDECVQSQPIAPVGLMGHTAGFVELVDIK